MTGKRKRTNIEDNTWQRTEKKSMVIDLKLYVLHIYITFWVFFVNDMLLLNEKEKNKDGRGIEAPT